MPANYNLIAPIYDFVAKIIFGKELMVASQYHCKLINENHTVLILGGGTGEQLKHIKAQKIVYVDSSYKMIKIAKKKNNELGLEVEYHVEDAFSWQDFSYDFILLPFFLDQFTTEQCIQLLNTIHSASSKNTHLIITDFSNKCNPWLLKLMYGFFRFTAGLKVGELPYFDVFLSQTGWQKVEEQRFSKGKVFSAVCKK